MRRSSLRKIPASERPRERLGALGVEVLTDQELLALVLRSGRPGTSALDLATELIVEFGSLQGIAAATPKELTRWPGVGDAKAAGLVAAFRLGRLSQHVNGLGQQLRDPRDVARIACQELRALRRERVIVLVCDGANRLKKVVQVSQGSIDRAMVPVREILNAVLVNDGRAFAVAHNHPSGSVVGSPQDLEATRQLRAVSAPVGVRWLSHVVVAGEEWGEVSV